jgi:hypothetical protein
MNEYQSIREQVAKAIESGKVTMRPKWHFVLRTALGIAGVFILILVLLYLVSFVIFMLYHTGIWFAPSFGVQGLYAFLFAIPWLFVLASIFFIALLEILVRRYEFAYRRPLLYSLLLISLFVLGGGFVIAQTSFHARLLRSAKDHHLPFAGGFYREFGAPPMQDVRRGTILGLTDYGFMIQDEHGTIIPVAVSPLTRLPLGLSLVPGTMVIVFGPHTATSVEAFGVRIGEEECCTAPQP